MHCSNCGAAVGDDLKFCGQCGTRVPETATMTAAQAERRQITVLFVDIVGSSSLSGMLDPEELRDLYAAYQKACAELVEHYDGHVAQYLGDGILAYFGYPQAHEDDAARAVQTGLEMLQRVDGIEEHGQHLRVRVGIHTGLVVVGDVGVGAHHEQLALGEAPNIAARLQAAAEPNTLLISNATRNLIGGQFDLEDLGKTGLKGLSRPVHVHRVLSRSGASSRFEARAASGLAPFIGRRPEVDALRAAWDVAVTGTGRTVLLRGEAGIGKSRLLGEARDLVQDHTHELFEAECSPYEGSNALHPIIVMLEHRLGLRRDQAPDVKLGLLEQFVAGRGAPVREAVPLLGELLGIPVGEDAYPPLALSPIRRRRRMLEVLADLLLHVPGGAPVVLLIEDLHWADPSTLELVEGILARQASSSLFMVCTTRPQLEVSWPEAPHWQEIGIPALPATDVRALVTGVVGGKELPTDVMKDVVERTGGVPLFVEAVTRTLLETGALRAVGDRYELQQPLPPNLIPPTVHGSLMARIDRLGPGKPVAQLASAIGREFSFELLQDVCGLDTAVLGGALERLVELDLVAQEGAPPSSEYTFKHALIQDAAYRSLLRATRQEVHGKIAGALVARFPEMAETDPALLAHHFEGAGQSAEAIQSWMAAGFQAQQRSAMLECIANLHKAIALLETMPHDDPARIQSEAAAQLALAPALMAARGWGAREVEVACNRARLLCEQTGDGQGLLTALWGLWTVLFVRGEFTPALETAQAVLGMAIAAENPILEVAARHAVGFTHYFRGEFLEAREHGEKGLALFSLEQERMLVTIFQIPSSVCIGAFLTQSLHFLGYPEQAQQRHEDLVALIGDLAIPACTAVGLAVSMYYTYELRDVDTLARDAEECITLSTEEGFGLWAVAVRVTRGWTRCMRGDTEGGLEEMREGLESYQRMESGIFVPQFCMMTAEGMRLAGRLDDALEALETAQRIAEEHGEHYYDAEIHRVRGEIQIQRGALGDGEETLRRGIDIAGRQHATMLQLRSAIPLARLLRDQDRGEEAYELLSEIDSLLTEGAASSERVQARALLEELKA
ncbi:MAG: adenylate/guanylate cyclase domain-containing protein [Planctomycetota bacterium]|nr:adenylate/guanylate cyclase domain-containing protein [Planctomycetota bacterium]